MDGGWYLGYGVRPTRRSSSSRAAGFKGIGSTAVESKRTCTALLASTCEAGILIEADVHTWRNELNCDRLENVL